MAGSRALPIVALFAAGERLDSRAFGALSVLLTAQAVAAVVTDLGTDGSATYLGSSGQLSHESLLPSLLRVKAVLSLGVSAAVVVPSLFVLPLSAGVVAAASLLLVAANVLGAVTASRRIALRLQAASHRWEAQAFLTERAVTAGLFLGGVVLLPPELAPLTLCFALASVVGPLVALWRLPRLPARVGRGVFRRLLLNALPFAAGLVVALVVWRVTVALLTGSGEFAEVGYFTAAYYPVQALAAIPAASAPLLLLGPARVTDRRLLAAAFLLGSVAAAVLAAVTSLPDGLLPAPLQSETGSASLLVCGMALPLVWFNATAASVLRRRRGIWAVLPAQGASLTTALVVAAFAVPAFGAVGGALTIVTAEAAAAVLVLVGLMRGVR